MNVGDGLVPGGRTTQTSLAACVAFTVALMLTANCVPARGQAGADLPAAAQPTVAAPPAAGAGSTGAPGATGAPGTPSAVTSLPGAPEEDIRDIRGPKYLAPVWLIPAIVAGAGLLTLLAYGIWRWVRRRREPRVLSSSEAALQRLEEIRVLMQPATVREFSIEISDVVRRYIERGFDITATHRTTEEFLHDLLETTHPALIGHRDLLAGFLEQCDLAKFAGMALTAQSMEALHASARRFVIESSKPLPDPPPAGAPSAVQLNPAPGARAS